MLFCTPCWKEKQPSRALKNTMAQMCPCSSVKNSLTHAAKYMLICRILHGWIPDNTDENLDWIKLLDLMKTNYLGDSQVYRKATHKNTASDNFPLNIQLTVVVLCHRNNVPRNGQFKRIFSQVKRREEWSHVPRHQVYQTVCFSPVEAIFTNIQAMGGGSRKWATHFSYHSCPPHLYSPQSSQCHFPSCFPWRLRSDVTRKRSSWFSLSKSFRELKVRRLSVSGLLAET